MVGLVLGFAAAIITTVILLGLGMLVGYQFGRRTVATPIVVARRKAQRAKSEQLGFLREASEALQRRNRDITDIARLHRKTAPPELLRAVDQLVQVAERLSQKLQGATDESKVRSPAKKAKVPITAQPSAVPAEVLSRQEMSELTGLPDQGAGTTRAYPYDCRQTVFPIVEGRPDTTEAVAVRCHEISGEGISFFLPDNPGFERLVISLGSDTNRLYMDADVLCSKTVYMHNEIRMLVSCRFNGRHAPLPVMDSGCPGQVRDALATSGAK